MGRSRPLAAPELSPGTVDQVGGQSWSDGAVACRPGFLADGTGRPRSLSRSHWLPVPAPTGRQSQAIGPAARTPVATRAGWWPATLISGAKRLRLCAVTRITGRMGRNSAAAGSQPPLSEGGRWCGYALANYPAGYGQRGRSMSMRQGTGSCAVQLLRESQPDGGWNVRWLNFATVAGDVAMACSSTSPG